MTKKNFAFLVLTVVGGLLFALGMCMCLLPQWNAFELGVVCTAIGGIALLILSVPCALGFNVWSGFVPFAEGSAWLDVWDFILNFNLLAWGALVFVVFCCSKRYGWGWDNFVKEANTGKGLKVKNWMKPVFCYVVPIAVAIIYIYGLVTYPYS